MKLATLLRELERRASCSISLEALHPAFVRAASLALPPDQYVHHAAFCRTRKLGENSQECIRNKRRSLEIAALGRAFRGHCPHGIEELAQPVMLSGRLAAVLYFGAASPEKTLGNNTGRYARFAAEFIRLELEIFLAEHPERPGRGEAFYLEQCQAYIDRQYTENIGLADLAQRLNTNANYLGGLLKRARGATFRELLTERRMAEARILLRLHRHLTIREIAFRCGFSDSNYFSTVFKRSCGESPAAFRTGSTR